MSEARPRIGQARRRQENDKGKAERNIEIGYKGLEEITNQVVSMRGLG
jgi:hypothetical protein